MFLAAKGVAGVGGNDKKTNAWLTWSLTPHPPAGKFATRLHASHY
jgi:hypothetical protein